jgi:hypothetical protein
MTNSRSEKPSPPGVLPDLQQVRAPRDEVPIWRDGVLLGIFLAFVAVVTVAYRLGTKWDPPSDDLEMETAKLILQALLVVTVGALLTALFDRLKARRTAADQARAGRNDVLDRIVDGADRAYQATKRVRRLGRLAPRAAEPVDHDRLMLELSEQQLVFERLRRDADALSASMPTGDQRDACRLAVVALTRLDTYLNDIWTEYERGPSASDSPAEELEMTWGRFLAPANSNVASFRDFKNAYALLRQAALAARFGRPTSWRADEVD